MNNFEQSVKDIENKLEDELKVLYDQNRAIIHSINVKKAEIHLIQQVQKFYEAENRTFIPESETVTTGDTITPAGEVIIGGKVVGHRG